MKKFEIEQLQERWLSPYELDKELLEKALEYSIGKIKSNLPALTYGCPSVTAPNGKYRVESNDQWTTGFWPGMVWIAYAMTGDKAFLDTGKIQSILFRERYVTDHIMQHHDIGFLFSLSTVADYMLTGDEVAKDTSIGAAYRLTKMYRKIPGIIQRSGDLSNLNDKFTGEFIVDCMNNVPLLFWAEKQTGDRLFYDIAYNHMKNSVASIVKDDGRVVQTGIADVIKGTIVSDALRSQGKGGDDAAWGRGQAWAIAGLPITYGYTRDPQFIDAAKAVTFYFLNRMPADLVANWDLYYTNDEEQRDTSASSIAVCGMLELVKYLPDSDNDKVVIENAAYRIMESLTNNYLTKETEDSMGLLNAGVYGMGWKGVNEPNIWGDYYYMEALYRILGQYKRFW